ncbi:potassium channel family protein [Marinicella rhabdoformis]|uniref:potassium channel family protein n=1 Tax=Marinicella rhabdoformis TaxID=2580566 RepID=UPI0031B6086B
MTIIWASLINCLVVSLAVLIHYECLFHMSKWVPKLAIKPRFRIVVGVFGALIAHSLEVWLFAFAYYFMVKNETWGSLTGNFDGSILDCVYFSYTNFTTLGYGDVVPSGDIRFLTGIESLTGLVLITWSASFLFFEMQKYWDSKK